eukprot:TRINITY_DN20105_c0_g1_i1.p1 TRINITY_DN20105_c0_g1~~TRINITY_DN20105_c0_g1_i1.p1  ORF type:complete len:332 (+),score=58.41 TRINITY_DN20105_c0_g1_i1:136-1131(+)
MRQLDYFHLPVAHDMIDAEIKELCRRWPAILEDNLIYRKSQGRYKINGRDVRVGMITREASMEDDESDESTWRSSPSRVERSSPSRDDWYRGPGDALAIDSDDLFVRDGPLSQPFLDYVFNTGRGERYDMQLVDAASHGAVLARTNSKHVFLQQEDRFEAMCRALAREASMESVDGIELGEVPVMPPPPTPPWKSPGLHGCSKESAKVPPSGQTRTKQLRATSPAEDVTGGGLGPQAALAALEESLKASRSHQPWKRGKRRHLYGEVILPGELASPFFKPDEPIEAEEVLEPVESDRSKMAPSKLSAPQPLPFTDSPEDLVISAGCIFSKL